MMRKKCLFTLPVKSKPRKMSIRKKKCVHTSDNYKNVLKL